MLSTISQHLKEKFKVFFLTDNLLFNNRIIPVSQDHFQEIRESLDSSRTKRLAFVDGGQAEILSGGNLNLSFIRVFGHIMDGSQKCSSYQHEFYILTTAVYREGELWYESKLFPTEGNLLVDERDLTICSTDPSIRIGTERAPISKIANLARRFAELRLAQTLQTEAAFVLLDGTLEPTYQHEEMYLADLGSSVSALAKTCSLFTTCGNSPVVLLQKLSPHQQCWSYFVDGRTYFVKLHPRAKHIFRFEGDPNILPFLIHNSGDPLFLGYPYGLLAADSLARVSNAEKNGLRMSLLLRDENRELVEYMQATNAHDILDSLR